MRDLHPARSEFQWYVTDGLVGTMRMWPSERAERFEQHVSDCDGCAAQLAQEAELELTFANAAMDCHRAEPVGRSGTLWLGALVAAAALLLIVLTGTGRAVGPNGVVPAMLAPTADAGIELVAIDSSNL